MTVAKRLVEKHGGTVTAFSDGPGKGSEFRVVLTLAPAPADPPSIDLPPKESVRRKILVVDDNRDALDLLAEFLTIIGNDVITASDGSEAISKASASLPRIIILDIGLPQLDGYEVAKKIRTLPGLVRSFLIALTGYGQPEDRLRTREAGFDFHLVKPAGLDEIKRAIDSLEN